MPRIVKVAIIGSGLAGLTAAHLLSSRNKSEDGEVEFQVHLFDKAPVLGMDSASVSLPVPDSSSANGLEFKSLDVPEWRIDVPMRSFQGGYYPQLLAFYRKLGISFRESNFSYSFSLLSNVGGRRASWALGSEDRDGPAISPRYSIATTMIYNGSSGRKGFGIPSIFYKNIYAPFTVKSRSFFFQPSRLINSIISRLRPYVAFTISLVYFSLCFFWMLFLSIPIFRPSRGKLRTMTFQQWIVETTPNGLIGRWTGMQEAWGEYAFTVLLPLFSAVCTAPEDDVLRHPVEEFLDYFLLTLGTNHYVVSNGTREVTSRLVINMRPEQIHLSSTICDIQLSHSPCSSSSMAPPSHKVTVRYRSTSSTQIQSQSGFDHIIFATQACRAVPLLKTYANSLSGVSLGENAKKRVEEQINCLQHFVYRDTLVVNHTDGRLMPDDPRDWRDLNLVFGESYSELKEQEANRCTIDSLTTFEQKAEKRKSRNTSVPSYLGDEDNECPCLSASYTMATHRLQRPVGYPVDIPVVYQTTNPIIPPSKDKVLSMARLERAVLTVESKIALEGLHQEGARKWWQISGLIVPGWGRGAAKLGKLQGPGVDGCTRLPGIWVCGSYAFPGIPLLEGCVASARGVVEQGIWASEGVKFSDPSW